MMDQPVNNTNFHALLIGIDFYLSNRLPDGSHYRNLSGCVRDISHVEHFLRTRLAVPTQNITKLTATDLGGTEPLESPDFLPTYENLVAAFHKLTAVAQPGDHVYIHYSGHGGRSPTILPEVKGIGGLDESLVPTDIGNSEARYLRDVEMAKLLSALIENQLLVTIVLDSCHSRGVTRKVYRDVDLGADVKIRGLTSIDTSARPTESLVGTKEELAETWVIKRQEGTRNVSSGWLPNPQGYVLLAACRSSEAAYEYAFDGKETNGALTYWLLKSLDDIGPGLTYKQLHDRLVAKIHSQFERQTPQLEGDGNRIVFGSDHLQTAYAALVMSVDASQRRLLINAGQVHGIRKGAEFAVYPLQTADIAQMGQRLALARVNELDATASWANYSLLGVTEIEAGAQAQLVNPGSVRLVRRVRLIKQKVMPREIETALRMVSVELTGSAWVEIATSNEPAQYELVVDSNREFNILDRAGESIANLYPAISIDQPNAARKIVQRLEHLSKYQAIQELDNNDPTSPLARKLLVELTGVQRQYDPVDKPEPTAFEMPGKPRLSVGEWTFLRIKNISTNVLNVVVLDLQPDWGVTQVYPTPPEWFVSLDPGQEEVVPFQAKLPECYDSGRDVLKVFAVRGTASFHWLQLPPLDEPRISRDNTRHASLSRLDQLLVAIASERPPTRNLCPIAHASHDWVTVQVEVELTNVEPKGKAANP